MVIHFNKGRTLYGGPAPEESKRRVAEFWEVLKWDKKTVMGIRKWLQEASANSIKIEDFKSLDGAKTVRHKEQYLS